VCLWCVEKERKREEITIGECVCVCGGGGGEAVDRGIWRRGEGVNREASEVREYKNERIYLQERGTHMRYEQNSIVDERG
jgi:hypothetical protein